MVVYLCVGNVTSGGTSDGVYETPWEDDAVVRRWIWGVQVEEGEVLVGHDFDRAERGCGVPSDVRD